MNPTHNRFTRTEGNYNFLNPSDVSAMYRFHLREDAPNNISRSMDLPIDRDVDVSGLTVSEAAQKIFEAANKIYIISTSREKDKALVEYLESMRDADDLDAAEYEVRLAIEACAEAEKKKAKAILALDAMRSNIESAKSGGVPHAQP